MPVPFTFRKSGETQDPPEVPPSGNGGQPDAVAARLERLREHTRVAIEDLGRLRLEVEAKTLQRVGAIHHRFDGLPRPSLRLGDTVAHHEAPIQEHRDSSPGGWLSVRPETVDELWAAGMDAAGTWLFTLLERVDELQGVVEWLIDRMEPVLTQAERVVARYGHAAAPAIDYAALDAQDRAAINRLVLLGAVLELVLALRLLEDDGSLVPGHDTYLEQVRRAAQ